MGGGASKGGKPASSYAAPDPKPAPAEPTPVAPAEPAYKEPAKPKAAIYGHVAQVQTLFELIDTDYSGFLGRNELIKALGLNDGGSVMFEWYDSIGKADGKISLAEFVPGQLAQYPTDKFTPEEITKKLDEQIAKTRSIVASQGSYGS